MLYWPKRGAILIQSGRLTWDALSSAERDKADLEFLTFADAAFHRTFGNDLLAVQRNSPNQPFKWNIRRSFQTDLSRRGHRARKSRTK